MFDSLIGKGDAMLNMTFAHFISNISPSAQSASSAVITPTDLSTSKSHPVKPKIKAKPSETVDNSNQAQVRSCRKRNNPNYVYSDSAPDDTENDTGDIVPRKTSSYQSKRRKTAATPKMKASVQIDSKSDKRTIEPPDNKDNLTGKPKKMAGTIKVNALLSSGSKSDIEQLKIKTDTASSQGVKAEDTIDDSDDGTEDDEPDSGTTTSGSETADEVAIKCCVCSKVFDKREQLNNHYKSVHGYFFICYVEPCNMGYQSANGCKLHMRSVHKMDPEYPCDKCKYIFKTEGA